MAVASNTLCQVDASAEARSSPCRVITDHGSRVHELDRSLRRKSPSAPPPEDRPTARRVGRGGLPAENGVAIVMELPG